MSNELIRAMFKHLVKTYSLEEAREILITKYPNSKELIMTFEKTDEQPLSENALETVQKAVKERIAKPKVIKEKAESKMDRARKLYEEAEDKSRKVIIGLFMAELDMSQAAASTYFYNCKKD